MKEKDLPELPDDPEALRELVRALMAERDVQESSWFLKQPKSLNTRRRCVTVTRSLRVSR